MSMTIAIQENLLPGATRREQFANAAAYGYGGIEARGNLLLGHVAEYRALSEQVGLPITTICTGVRGCLLDPDPTERQAAVDSILELLRAGHALGGAHLIAVPIFGKPRLPDLSPYQSAVELEDALILPLLRQIARAAEAERLTAKLLLEPLNRYETHFLNRVEQAVELAEHVGSATIGVIADFFHMHIEEADIDATLRHFAGRIDHLHLADSNRKLPGQGHMAYARHVATLRETGYGGALALECGILGDPTIELPRSAALLNGWAGR
ncbi:MAG: sugar phosphate isomerase/epimerase [Chloroflexi bacterium]|nr:sugar phosphate isomerase/epimerase [Chloroflexota bacterium]